MTAGLGATAAILSAIRRTRSPRARERSPVRLQVRPVLQGPLRPPFAGISAFEFGNCAASGIAGLLWTAVGPSWAFGYLAAWMALAAVLLTRLPPRPAPGAGR